MHFVITLHGFMRTMKKSDAFVSNFDINQQDNKEYVVKNEINARML